MAERAISSAVEKIGQLLGQEAAFLRGVRGEVEWLRTELLMMECFLEDADAKQRKGDRRVKNWVREVRDVAYQAEDALDTFMLKIDSRSRANTAGLRRYACIPCGLIDLHDIGNEILQIKSKINNIKQNREVYGIINLGESRAAEPGVDERFHARRRSSCRLDDEAVVVGFDVNKKLILEQVLEPNILRRCGISIVGMGGLGKTTLAAKVYNSNEVKSHFNTCAWITVSQDYRVTELLKDINKKVMGAEILGKEDFESLEKMTLDELKTKLSNFLQHERYMIVLDDIWDEAAWEQIKDTFPNANNGSRLLVTTRFMNVARCVDPRITPFELPLLSDEDSWELFLKVVFPSDPGVTPSCPKELEELGKELVKRCGGLPLAVVVLGGMLSTTDPTVYTWREVAENKEWESRIQGQECLQILALSYNHLPHRHLKSCFLYLGCFPEDYKIDAAEVMRLWIAEGFIPFKDNRTFEGTAESYLNELAQRCMIQVVERRKGYARIQSFRVHDLFRDWCISEAKEDGFFRICSNRNYIEGHDIVSSCRLVLYGEVPGFVFGSPTHKARTMLGFNLDPADEMFLKNVVHRFNLLRVIYLRFHYDAIYQKNGLPKEISTLIHLRYILIAARWVSYIPSSIGKLRHLQSIWVDSRGVTCLPKTVWTIETLQYVSAWDTLIKAGSGIERNLPKFSGVDILHIAGVRASHVTGLSDSLPKLNDLVFLSLEAAGDDKPRPSAASLFAPFPSHQHLKNLCMDNWTAIRSLPCNLTRLVLNNCILDGDAIVVLERLPILTALELRGCHFAEEGGMVCSAGGFPKLRQLEFDVKMLKYWRIERGAMSMLSNLSSSIRRGGYNDEMMVIPEGLEHVASLVALDLAGPRSNISRRLATGGDLHWVRRIPNVLINRTPLDGFLQEIASTSPAIWQTLCCGSTSAEGESIADAGASTSYEQGST